AAKPVASPAASAAGGNVAVAPPAVRLGSRAATSTSGARVKASPLARKMAAAKNVNLSTVSGTGPGGRIVARDVETAASRPVGGGGVIAAVPSMPAGPNDKVIPLGGMRRVIADRLLASTTHL